MDRKTVSVIESVGGYAEFEQLVKQGRQMHDQAVFELIIRLVSHPILSLRKACGVSTAKKGPGGRGRWLYANQSS